MKLQTGIIPVCPLIGIGSAGGKTKMTIRLYGEVVSGEAAYPAACHRPRYYCLIKSTVKMLKQQPYLK
jgi:hypothetical protein